jgi:hypothetical protein
MNGRFKSAEQLRLYRLGAEIRASLRPIASKRAVARILSLSPDMIDLIEVRALAKIHAGVHFRCAQDDASRRAS